MDSNEKNTPTSEAPSPPSTTQEPEVSAAPEASNSPSTSLEPETPPVPEPTIEESAPPPATPPPLPPASPGPSGPNFFQKVLDRIQAWIQSNPRRAAVLGGVILLLLLSLFIRAPRPHVALSGEPLVPGGWLTNSMLTTLVVDVVLLALAFLATARMQLVPSGLQNAMEAIIEYLYNLAESVAGKAAGTYFPWAATIFLFLLLSNYSGLIPGVGSIGFFHTDAEHADRFEGRLAMANGSLLLQEGGEQEEAPGEGAAATEEHADEEHATFVPLFRAPSADLNLTFALAIATMVMVQYYGIRALGGNYLRKFWNTSGQGFMKGINIFTGILETISEIARILSFSFRLFGNIFAGEVVLATMAFLITFLLPVPFYALELLVGAIQALVFAMLALVFFSMATISHGHDEHGEHAEAHH